jgi:hypothetical protein
VWSAVTENNEKGRPATWTASSFSRENSSNGGSKAIRTFWQKSYEGPKASVKEFLENKHFCFQ